MAFLDRFMAAYCCISEFHLCLLTKKELDIVAQRALIVLQRKDVVSLFVDDQSGDLALASHSVDGDDGAVYFQ